MSNTYAVFPEMPSTNVRTIEQEDALYSPRGLRATLTAYFPCTGLCNRVGKVIPLLAPGVCQLANILPLDARAQKKNCNVSLQSLYQLNDCHIKNIFSQIQ